MTARQLGTERTTEPPTVVHRPASKRAASGARVALLVTAAAWAWFAVDQLTRLLAAPLTPRRLVETAIHLVLITFLTGSGSAYLLARIGFLKRISAHQRVPRARLDAFFAESQPTMTVIVPSYREDARIIRQTLLSAALQEYPHLRVVLLVDDPPQPGNDEQRAMLDAARRAPLEITELLTGPRLRFDSALTAFETASLPHGALIDGGALTTLAEHYRSAALWLRAEASGVDVVDHSDVFLASAVLSALASDFEQVAGALTVAADHGAAISMARAHQLYRRLVWTFRAEVSSFERKQYASLSDESNKAMNLNSYIGLMGRRFRVQATPTGKVLIPVNGGHADLEVPNPDYVLTLDADSMLLPEYCLRLVHFMEQPDNADVAVVQTPYSAYRGAATRIERIAGATTDLQHIVHQGLTAYGATFWVGANAVIRKVALDAIGEHDDHQGFTVVRYIRDRTVIEDTESSLDIRLKGWRLHNYPERLSFSATPPDLGALAVQRQRWANGGLLMVGKWRQLLRASWHKGNRRSALVEAFLRMNYLASIAWASFGLVVLLAFPFDGRLVSRVAVLTALPYFMATASDLRRCGYKRSDVIRLYGFNLLLLPVNVAGVISSIGQAISGQKIAFARTPKVSNRTAVRTAFVVTPYAIVLLSLYALFNDVVYGRTAHAVFAGVNAVLTLYAVVAFHGVRNSLADIAVNTREYVMKRRTIAVAAEAPALDWISVLYHGTAVSGEADSGRALASALAAMDLSGEVVDLRLEAPEPRVYSPVSGVSRSSIDWSNQ